MVSDKGYVISHAQSLTPKEKYNKIIILVIFLAVDNLKSKLFTICFFLYICVSKIDLESSYRKDIIPKISEDIS